MIVVVLHLDLDSVGDSIHCVFFADEGAGTLSKQIASHKDRIGLCLQALRHKQMK